MLWLLVLHIMALLFWAVGLLYLPLLLAASGAGHAELTRLPSRHDSVARFVFTHIATPAALLAIITGTLVFLAGRTVSFWLIAKLSVVTLLVICHVVAGLLVLRAEDETAQPLRRGYWILAGVLCLLMTTILWIVLAKPTAPEISPWIL
jgi:protoporphyrinogen IX oxidase